MANLFFYTEFKNLIARVAHLKQLRGEHQWVVTPRTAGNSAPPSRPPTPPRRWPHDHADRHHPHHCTRTETPRASRPLYPLTWARGLAAILVLTFHAYQHNRTWPRAPGRGRAPPTS